MSVSSANNGIAVGTGRRDVHDAVYCAERILERLGDLILYPLRARARICSYYNEIRKAEFRQEIQREPHYRHSTESNNRNYCYKHCKRILYAEFLQPITSALLIIYRDSMKNNPTKL